MATYIQGVQDRVEKIRPPQPNLQFEAQLLQARQAKYDAGHKKLSDMYGKILNSGLTRQGNIQARDEFFKLIDQDLQKIAGMDLSLDSNVSKAQRVFSQVYENDYLVKDMVWTKNFQNEMKRAEAFKNCVDPEKCGGQYWEDGVKAMQYKRQEFAETDNADSLNYGNVSFVPYHNLMEKAMKHAKDSGIDITQDVVQGDYKYTYKNGQLILNPLTDLFSKLYADNPAYQEQFEVQAYNARKDWASGQVAAGNFEDMQAAEVGYITQRSEQLNKAVESAASGIGADAANIDKQLEVLTQKIKDGKVAVGSAEALMYQNLMQLKPLSDQAKNFAEVSKTAMKKANDHKVVRNIGAQLDKGTALALMNNDIKKMAGIMSNRDASVTMEADEFATMRVKHMYDVSLANLQSSNRMNEEYYKAQLGHSSYRDKDGGGPISIANHTEKEFNKVFGNGSVTEKTIEAEAMNEFGTKYSSGDLDKVSSISSGDTFTDDQLKKYKPEDFRNDPPKARALMEAQNQFDAKRRAEYINKHKAKILDKRYKEDMGTETSFYDNLFQGGQYSPNVLIHKGTYTGGEGGSNKVIPPPPRSGGGAAYYPNTGTGQPSGGQPSGGQPSGRRSSGGSGGSGKTKKPTKNTSTSGKADGVYFAMDDKGNQNEYQKKGDKWFKKVDGKFMELTKGDVEERKAYLEKNAYGSWAKDVVDGADNPGATTKYADYDWRAPGVLEDEHLQYLADNLSDPVTKNFYKNIIKQGGVKNIKNLSKEDQDLIYNNVGKRLDQLESKQQGPYKDGKIWKKTEKSTFKVKPGEESFKTANNTAQKIKLEKALTISSKYLDSLDPEKDADEIKEIQKMFERQIIKGADISKSTGGVTYRGKDFGRIYYDRDGGQVAISGVYGSATGDKWDKRDERRGLDYVELDWRTRDSNFSLENMKKMLKDGNNYEWVARSITKKFVQNRVPENQSNYFSRKDQDGITQYQRDIADFQENEEIHQGLVDAKKENAEKIQKFMGEYLQQHEGEYAKQGDERYLVDEHTGYFTWPENWSVDDGGETMKIYKDAYDDAMHKVFKEGYKGKYNVSPGSKTYYDIKATNVDMKDKSDGIVHDVQEVIEQAQLANTDLEGGATGAVYINGIDGDRDEILNDILEGKYDVESVTFNPIGGKSPTAIDYKNQAKKAASEQTGYSKLQYQFGLGGLIADEKEALENAKKEDMEYDYSRMSIKLSGGRSVTIDLDNNKHMNQTRIYRESTNTRKAEVLNKVGEYTYQANGMDIKNITNNANGKNPVKIHLAGDKVGVSGEIYYWDTDTQKGMYANIQRDILDAGKLPIWGSPEELELMLDGLMQTSQAMYDAHQPKLQL
jgi:hypothetical protein